MNICNHMLVQDKFDPEYVVCLKCKTNFQLQRTNTKVYPRTKHGNVQLVTNEQEVTFKNPCITEVRCSFCGKELDAYYNTGYDGAVTTSIACYECVKNIWEIVGKT